MNLKQYSQSSLQTFKDCNRKYYHQYLQMLDWPSVVAEPANEQEKKILAGQRIHKMIHQFCLGLPIGDINAIGMDPIIKNWWEIFLNKNPIPQNSDVYPEKTITSKLGDTGLIAKYDLICVHNDGKITIFDWKTSRSEPDRQKFQEQLQTKLYLYVLAKEGLNSKANNKVPPEQIEMVYWFFEHPEISISFQYSEQVFREDDIYLRNFILELESRQVKSDFPKTPHFFRCKYCKYRSLCGRGDMAGSLTEFENQSDIFDDDSEAQTISEIDPNFGIY